MKNAKFSLYRTALKSSSTLAAVAMLATPAFAQDAAQEAQEAADEDTIIITGSRITNPNLEQSSPVSVVGEGEINLRQATDAENLIGELPGVSAGISSSVNNGSGGFATFNLRGFGSNRNLVLLDGQRIVPTNLSAVTDLNNIPVALIERVDIVTGGASSVYGADAVTGVVNFITKRDFEGIALSSTFGVTEKGDGQRYVFDLTTGASFDDGRGNAVLSIGYQKTDPVLQGDRSISTNTFFGRRPLGSGTSVPTRINSVQYNPATGRSQRTQTFNYAPFNYFQTPFERFNVFAKAHYEVIDGIEVYSKAMYSRNKVNLQLAPSGLFGDTYMMPLNNPFLPVFFRNAICAAAATPIPQAACDAAGRAVNSQDANYREVPVVINRRLVEQGNRQTEYLTNMFQFTAGVRGDITDDIRFDLFGQYGESDRAQTNINWGLKSRVQQALRATSATTCDPTTSPLGNCSPINLFGNGRAISQAFVNFINQPNGTTVKTSLAVVNGSITGDLDNVLWSDTPIGFAIGGEYRKYTASQNADVAASTQDEVLGTGAPDPLFSGAFDVKEVFGELIVPLVSDMPGFYNVTFEAGARYSHYSTSGGSFTWKGGGTWEPVEGYKIRGIYQKAVRSPNIFELFNPPVTGLNNRAEDPCQGAFPVGNAALTAICIGQGAPAASIGRIPAPSAGQINQTSGGNRNLKPETAKSWTIGAVITPPQVPGLAITVDFYSIKVTDAITVPSPGDIFRPCFGTRAPYASPPGNRAACALIRRNPLNGSLNGGGDTPGLLLTRTNQGTLKTSGVDFRVQYGFNVPFGGLAFDLNGNWTREQKFQATPTSVNRECVGFYSQNCDPSVPKLTFNLRSTATIDGFGDVSVLWRWQGKMAYEPLAGNPFGAGNNLDLLRIGARSYFDLSVRVPVGDHFEFSALVQNVLNKKPPFVGSFIGATGFNSGNTYPSSYDTLGRRYTVTGKLRF